MAQPQVKIRKGQKWRKKILPNGAPPFYALVIGRAKGDRAKVVCSDGNTHSILPFILLQKFELVAD
jgi:hypothetical protein